MDPSPTIHAELAEALTSLGAACTAKLGDRLVAVILYGSAARGLYEPGYSDVNLLLVLTEAGTAELASLRECLAAFADRWRITPYLVTQKELPAVAEAFPTRVLEMKRGYKVLLGCDVLADIAVDRTALAARAQQELLNVLLRFRHLLLGPNTPAALEADLRSILPGFIKVLRTLVYLRTGRHLDDRDQLVTAGATAYGFPETPLRQLLIWRAGQVVLEDREWDAAAAGFLDALRKVAGAAP